MVRNQTKLRVAALPGVVSVLVLSCGLWDASFAATKPVQASAGAACASVGSTATTRTEVLLTCVKSGTKRIWVNAAVPISSLPTTSPATGSWVNATANLAGLPSECGNLTMVSSRTDRDAVIVGVALKGLWVIKNGASTWTPLGQGEGSEPILNRPSSMVYDRTAPDTFWESGIYNGDGVFRTNDDGVTFKALKGIGHVDVVAVDLTDPARKTLLASGHESSKLYLSVNGGDTWAEISSRLPPGTVEFAGVPVILDAKTFLLGTGGFNAGARAKVLRSADSGSSWSVVSSGAVWGKPMIPKADGTMYWLLANGAGVIRSTDRGASWVRVLGPGLVAGQASSSENIVELPDGRVAVPGTERILVSRDRGATWTPVGPRFPFSPAGLTYSPFRKSFYISHWDCGNAVLPDAVMRYQFSG